MEEQPRRRIKKLSSAWQKTQPEEWIRVWPSVFAKHLCWGQLNIAKKDSPDAGQSRAINNQVILSGSFCFW